jgi:arginine utilization regulatory protein
MKLVDLQKVVTGHDERVLTNNTKYSFKDILTNDMSMIKIISKVMRIAQNEAHIVLSGETGTGKELFAHSIHNSSFRKEKPFIAQNCAAIPETLLESILFGTSKGSFTGSVDRPGLLELSNGGTLMLDEINSMPISLQVKLLRVVQDGRFRRLGENKIREVDIRIIAALNEDPFKAIEEGRLRRDLFYRLSTNIVEIPPLRERTLDIEYLSQSFVRIYNDMYKKNIKGFDKRVIDLFQSFGWPGNVRELEHVVQSAVNECEKSLITMEDLPQYIFKSEKKNENTSIEFKSLHEHIKVYENTLIKKVLDDNNWNVSKSAKELGIPRQTLQYKIKEMSAR